MSKVFVSTSPFCAHNSLPLRAFEEAGHELVINSSGRKLCEEEILELSEGCVGLIAGTEFLSTSFFEKRKELKFVCRVGIGLDGLPLNFCRANDIAVTYTPDAPAPAVAELSVGLAIALLRQVVLADQNMRNGVWKRIAGLRLAEITIGIIGVGRIGGRVLRRLAAFGSPRILANDIAHTDDSIVPALRVEWVDKTTIFEEADLIFVHVPLTPSTKNMIDMSELESMKTSAFLVNPSRGGIVNEDALNTALERGMIAGAAVDVFTEEPYSGPLLDRPNAILTPHLGSMSIDCRTRMEIEASMDALRILVGEAPLNPVPHCEYQMSSR